MSDTEAAAARNAEQLIQAMENLRTSLEQREASLRQALEAFSSGHDFGEALNAARIAEERVDLNEALASLEQCRRETRLAGFRAALDHGVSINELSRIWGFSRQMASRYAKEARGEA
ncbi:MAG: hypothetical protein ACLQPH_13565 [Acidimicrobiales bacterium]